MLKKRKNNFEDDKNESMKTCETFKHDQENVFEFIL
jgi:hypothetical protein